MLFRSAIQAPGLTKTNQNGKVAWRTDRPNRIELEVETVQPMMLVLSDSWFPGWECRVDGVVTPIFRANFIHRAVEIFPGRHEVSFAYEPVGMRLGIKISLATLLFLVTAGGMVEIRLQRIAKPPGLHKTPGPIEAKS